MWHVSGSYTVFTSINRTLTVPSESQWNAICINLMLTRQCMDTKLSNNMNLYLQNIVRGVNFDRLNKHMYTWQHM